MFKKVSTKKTFSYVAIASLALYYFSFVFVFSSALAYTATNLVISEIQIAGGVANDDFIELYNPTAYAVSLDGYRLRKQASTGTESNIITFSSSHSIPAFGYFLWANSGYTAILTIPDVVSADTLANNNGVALQKFDNIEEVWTNIDKAGWGTSFTGAFYEGAVYPNGPSANTGLERLPGESDALKGNGSFTGSNANDFAIRTTSEPQNSLSAMEIPTGMSLPSNIPPVSSPGSNQIVLVNATVSFDGSASTDSDGTITEYLWGFGDTTTATGITASHIYSVAGQYTISLRVTDDDGAQNIKAIDVLVADAGAYSDKILLNEFMPAPGSTTDWDSDGVANSGDEWIEIINTDTVAINLSGWIIDDIEGGSTAFTLGGTTIEPGAVMIFYKNETGLVLNNTGDTVRLITPIGTVNDSYTYTATATDQSYSRDRNNAESNWTTTSTPSPGQLNPLPPNQLPIASAGIDQSIQLGTSATFSGINSSDADGIITSFAWDFGDSLTGSGVEISHLYATAGNYTVILTVTDDRGDTATDSLTANVFSPPPAYTAPPEEQVSGDGSVIITEILPDPGSGGTTSAVISATGEEYIKLKNIDTKKVNLKGWILDDGEGGSKPYIINYDKILAPDETAIFYSSETKLALNNTGDSARLLNKSSAIVSTVSYLETAKKGVPLTLGADGKWAWGGTEEASKQVSEPANKQEEETEKQLNKEAIKTTTDNQLALAPSAPTEEALLPYSSYTPFVETPTVKIEKKSNYNPVIKLDLGEALKDAVPTAVAADNFSAQTKSEPRPWTQSPYLIGFLMLMAIAGVVKFVIGPEYVHYLLSHASTKTEKQEAEAIKELFEE